MLSNYFTFYHSALLLNARYSGAVIAEVYSQEKHTLSMVVYTPEPHTIVISCAGRQNFITARLGTSRSKNNSVDLFPLVINDHLHSVVMNRADRIVYLRLASGKTLSLEMFGARANVLLCASDPSSGNGRAVVIDAFLNKKEVIGTERSIDLKNPDLAVEDFLPDTKQFATAFPAPEKNMLQSLKSFVPKLGTTLCKEVLHRAGTRETAAECTADEQERIIAETRNIIGVLLGPTQSLEPSLYFDERSPVVVTLIPLQYYDSLRREAMTDIFTAVQKFLSYGKSERSTLDKKKEIVHWLANETTRTERTIAAVEKELSESSRAEQYERFGKLLMSHLHIIARGLKSIGIEDHFSGGAVVEIPLDPSLSPVHNAERYFEKAKKAKSAHDESEQRLITLRQRRAWLSPLLAECEGISDSISLKNFLHYHTDQLKRLGFMTEKEKEELPPFKIFTVDGGFTVYAGKSSANNDTLTVQWAKPNDLWFHARGSSGSHVVLKVGSGNGTPSKKAIEQAASIAAYYSKMKNARNVPVAMTEKKYVRKPKGVPAGTVVIEKEKVIFVPPTLPHTED